MKLVCINRKWQRFESKGLEPDHARVPPFPLQIHAQKDECHEKIEFYALIIAFMAEHSLQSLQVIVKKL